MTDKFEDLLDYAVENGASKQLLNTILRIGKYTALLEAVVKAGGVYALGKTLQMSPTGLTSYINKGFVPLDTAFKIEEAFNLPVHALIDPKHSDMVRKSLQRIEKKNK